MLKNIFFTFIFTLSCLALQASSLDLRLETEKGGGKDSLKSEAENPANKAGVQVKKLDISPSSINPDLHKCAHWDTIDIDMYHVDMASFRDTLTYVMHRPATGHEFHPPHQGRVTSGFGPRKLYGRKFHKGIDIDLETGDRVSAAMAGKIRIARYSTGYGNFVVIAHEGGLETLYGHMSELQVTEGEYVNAGEIIGLGGSTGQSTGSHLHFELRIFGEQVNPLFALDKATFMPLLEEIKIDPSWFSHLAKKDGNAVAQYHVVGEGETLDGICAMYEMDKYQIFILNELTPEAEVAVGMRLRIN